MLSCELKQKITEHNCQMKSIPIETFRKTIKEIQKDEESFSHHYSQDGYVKFYDIVIVN